VKKKEMTREEFDRIGRGVAQAAQFLPSFDYARASEMNDRILKGMKDDSDKVKFSEETHEAVRAYGRLLLAAGKFKEAADEVVRLGLLNPEIQVPLEEKIEPDTRPSIIREADTPPASRRTDRSPHGDETTD
jgi:hypothetical protein